MKSNKKYYEELNIFRGIVIIWVVIGHSFVGDDTFFGHLNTYAYTFHMSSFFILSGILFAPKLEKISGFKDGVSVAFGRFKRLIIPYLFFTLVSYILKIFFNEYAYNEQSYGWNIVHDVLFGVNNPNGGIWFLHNLFILSLFAIILKFIPSVVMLLLSSVLYAVNFFININSDFSSLIGSAPFFFFGIFVSSYYDKISQYILSLMESPKKKLIYFSCVALALLSFAVFSVYVDYSLSKITPAFKLIPCIVNILFWYVLSVCLTSTEKLKKPINCIGNYGMDIYMIGYYIQISIRVILGSILGIPYIFYSICMFVFGLVLPIPISKYIVRKIPLLKILALGDFSKKVKW